ncbi:MAG: hypothetical protein COA91_12265 [Robiginitomaculum sp.]|nr:MAG: hypothetical protein COA91_12265 [Robiginitomaculum sp.]
MPSYTDYEHKLFSMVDEHGWQCTYVFDSEGKQPDFAYSVGFTKSLNAPEFIVFGLPKNIMNHIIWEVFRQVKNGATPVDGMRWHGLLESFDCIIRKARHKDLYTEFTISANWFWRETGNTGNPEVYQIVWPGAQQGLFPWDDGCAQDVIDSQPHLWLLE